MGFNSGFKGLMLQKFNLIDWVVARSKQICKLSQEQKAASSPYLCEQLAYN